MQGFRASIIGLIILAVIAGAYYFNRGRIEEKERVEAASRTPVELKTADLVRLTITPAGAAPIVCVRQGDDWQLTEPVLDRGDRQVINALLDSIAGVAASADPFAPKAALADYGLATPEITLTLLSSASEEVTLRLGHKTSTNVCFVQREGADTIWPMPAAVRTSAERDLFQLREKDMIEAPWDDVRRIDMKTPMLIASVSREQDGTWQLIDPLKALGQEKKIREIVTRIDNVRAKQFFDDPSQDQLAAWGLISAGTQVSEPSSVTVWVAASPDQPVRLLIGNRETSESAFYAMIEGQRRAFLLEDSFYSPFPERVMDLRPDKLLDISPYQARVVAATGPDGGYYQAQWKDYSTWALTFPIDATAANDAVESVIRTFNEALILDFVPGLKSLAEYGLDPPSYQFRVEADSSVNVPARTILLGKAKDDNTVYGKWAEYDDIFVIDKILVDKLKGSVSSMRMEGLSTAPEPEPLITLATEEIVPELPPPQGAAATAAGATP